MGDKTEFVNGGVEVRAQFHILCSIALDIHVFIRKPFFCPSLNFLNTMLEVRLAFSNVLRGFYFLIFFNSY